MSDTAARLLAWYDQHRRTLPWRALPGVAADPYKVWLSEVMLQQTTVPTAAGYFLVFTQKWPTVADLAAAPLDDVLAAWAGLGYYARARNLHACARAVVANHQGLFPAEEAALLALPGVGPYTAAAVAAIAFGQRAVVVDGNVERVVARLFALDTPFPKARKEVYALTDALTPISRAGDFAQAMMDLGAGVCTPRQARCVACPLQPVCKAAQSNDPTQWPIKAAKKSRPARYSVAFVGLDPDGRLLAQRRPDTGLFGGMTDVPNTGFADAPLDPAAVAQHAPFDAPWVLVGDTKHLLTHLELHTAVYTAVSRAPRGSNAGFWVEAADIAAQAWPTAVEKSLVLAGVLPAPRKSSKKKAAPKN